MRRYELRSTRWNDPYGRRFDTFGHMQDPPLSREDQLSAEWDVPRPAATCRHLLEAARLHDIAASVCLADTDLTLADIEDSATEVQAGQELRMVRNILAHVDDSHDFARAVGLQYNFANTGILGYALLASPTIGDAINVACRYASLSSSFLGLNRQDGPLGAVIEFDNSHVPADVREFMLERDMYAITNLAPLLIGQLDADVVLTVEVPGFALPLERLEFARLTIEIDTSSARSAIAIPAEVLRLAMPAADAATAQACVQQCEDLLQARRQRRGMAALVRTRLIRDPGQIAGHGGDRAGILHHRTHHAPSPCRRTHQLPRTGRRGSGEPGLGAAGVGTHRRRDRPPARLLRNRRIHPRIHPHARGAAQ